MDFDQVTVNEVNSKCKSKTQHEFTENACLSEAGLIIIIRMRRGENG